MNETIWDSDVKGRIMLANRKEIGLEYVHCVVWVMSGTNGRPLSMW